MCISFILLGVTYKKKKILFLRINLLQTYYARIISFAIWKYLLLETWYFDTRILKHRLQIHDISYSVTMFIWNRDFPCFVSSILVGFKILFVKTWFLYINLKFNMYKDSAIAKLTLYIYICIIYNLNFQ